MIPQLIIIILLSASFTLSCVKHGEDKGKYHAGWSLLAIIVEALILYWGGFFDKMIK